MSLSDVEMTVVHVTAEHIEYMQPYGYRETAEARRKAGDDPHKAWACDTWRVTLSYQGRTFATDYRTGIGHRRAVKEEDRGYYQGHETAKKKITSKAVLEALFSDASSGGDYFESWCEDMGLSSDSRKALDTYLTCQHTATALRKLFQGDYSAIEKGVRDDQG